MTLEERLRRYAEKGELVHLSLAFYDGQFHAKLALASTLGGYASAEDKDPVAAVERVFTAAPVKVRATPYSRRPPLVDSPEAITATVNGGDINEEKTGLPADWTNP
jgi:hypothetical protein